MNRFLNGLMAGASGLSYGGEFVPASLCSIEGEGAGGGAGAGGGGAGAASLLDDEPGAGAGAGAGGDGAAAGGGEAGGEQGGGTIAEWMKGFSAEAPGEGELPNQEWLAKKGFKTPDDAIKALRSAEKTLSEGGRVKIPGEDAKPEEIAAFHKAIGVPEKAEDYVAAIALPELGEGEGKVELDTAFIAPLAARALAVGVPLKAFNELAQEVIKFQLDSMHADMTRNDTDRDAKYKEWGPELAARKQDFRRGAEVMGLSRTDIAGIQLRIGAGRTMDMIAKIGGMAGEDVLAGGGRQSFGVGSAEEAQGKIDAMRNDPAIKAKLKAKDPATVATWNRLNEAAAFYKEQAAKKK